MSTSEITSRFDFYISSDPHINELHHQIRITCEALAILIDGYIADSREKSIALTKVEEAMFWSNAGLSRQNGVPANTHPPYTATGL